MLTRVAGRAVQWARAGWSPLRWARASLAFLVLVALHLGVARAALGMQCDRASSPAMVASDAGEGAAAAAGAPSGEAPSPPPSVPGCGAAAWIAGVGPSLPAMPLETAAVPDAPARAGPDVARTPPFHPPRAA